MKGTSLAYARANAGSLPVKGKQKQFNREQNSGMSIFFRKSILFILMILAFEQVTAQNKVLLVPYHARNGWGFSDTLANIVIKPADYDSVDFFDSHGIAKVYKKRKINIVDSTGNILLKDYCDGIET